MIDPGPRIDIESSMGDFVKDKRWYGSKGKSIRRVELEYFSRFSEQFFLSVSRFFYEDGSSERYFVPFSLHGSGNSFVSVSFHDGTRKLFDATDDPEFALLFMRLIMDPATFSAYPDALRTERTPFSHDYNIPGDEVRKITAEQSNTSIVIGNKFILKIYRKIIGTENPDYTIPVILWQETGFRQTPMPLGKADLLLKDRLLIATVFRFLQESMDGWSRFTGLLQGSLHSGARVNEILLLEDAAQLGSLTGNMHSALKIIRPGNDLLFHEYAEKKMLPGVRANLEDIRHSFSISRNNLPEHVRIKIDHLLDSAPKHLERLHAIADKFRDLDTMVVHGDYHLGQVLYHDKSYYVIDFEGEPMRDTSGSFIISLPHKDIAGMIRSFDYSLAYSLKATGKDVPQKFRIEWLNEMMRQFIQSYMETSNINVEIELLDLFLAEKAIYELKYELNNRPDWLDIPLTFLERL